MIGNRGSERTESSSPGLWVIPQDVEEGVDAGFELPGSKNVGEMGDVAFPPERQEGRALLGEKQPHDKVISQQRWRP